MDLVLFEEYIRRFPPMETCKRKSIPTVIRLLGYYVVRVKQRLPVICVASSTIPVPLKQIVGSPVSH